MLAVGEAHTADPGGDPITSTPTNVARTGRAGCTSCWWVWGHGARWPPGRGRGKERGHLLAMASSRLREPVRPVRLVGGICSSLTDKEPKLEIVGTSISCTACDPSVLSAQDSVLRTQ